MITDLTIALRSLLRNRRRTLTTLAAVIVGAVAVMIFGGFAKAISLGLETGIARQDGHLHIYARDYLDYGAANPTDYAIDRPGTVIALLHSDPEIARHLVVATPVMRLAGIAGNFQAGVSKTFLGVGLVPADAARMAAWDGYRLGGRGEIWDLRADAPETAIVGVGMGRMLALCDALKIAGCQDRPPAVGSGAADAEILDLAANLADTKAEPADPRPQLDLLAATGKGMPNVVSVRVAATHRHSIRALDDALVGLHLTQAQRLLYGGADKATAIILQLTTLKVAPQVKARIEARLKDAGLDLEVRGIGEFNPNFDLIRGMFGAIFLFVSIVVGIVVLFTVANTMTMSVMERIGEVGTLRALGVRRSGIRRQFLIEGLLIGVIGATLGVICGAALAELINAAGLSWHPPSDSKRLPLVLLPLAGATLPVGLWLGMILVTSLSSLLPANRAAKLTIVDAIRHV